MTTNYVHSINFFIIKRVDDSISNSNNSQLLIIFERSLLNIFTLTCHVFDEYFTRKLSEFCNMIQIFERVTKSFIKLYIKSNLKHSQLHETKSFTTFNLNVVYLQPETLRAYYDNIFMFLNNL